MEKLKYAYAYGADAAYIGGKEFGLRAYAGNFSTGQIAEAVRLARRLRRKLYVTVNIFAHEQDLENMPAYLKTLEQLGVDGAIVSDPGVIALAKETAPGLALHLSTQANNTNSYTVNYWLHQGIQRVVLARELSQEELRQIRAKTRGELELFVHGAMCVSYSGRCLLSHYLTGRDANRGACTQPCRWKYALVEEKRPGAAFPIEEDSRGSYIFNSHDLCLLPHLPELQTLGIESWKIEGRMKSLYYVAGTVKVYREGIDTLWEEGAAAYRRRLPEWQSELDKISHRAFWGGFLFGQLGEEAQNTTNSQYIREYDFVGVSLDHASRENTAVTSDMAWVEQRNHFRQGERLEVLTPGQTPWSFEITAMLDQDRQPILAAPHAQMQIGLPGIPPLPPFSILRRAKG
ncbi:MAG: U32 family peptidase C-terminal domain-containing protein [Peptococcaceae bacterium]|nr:U32 family peptidase C-terminal domain-containing protein [Peptococcaceae bacterium]